MSEVVSTLPAVSIAPRRGNWLYTEEDIVRIRERYFSGERVVDISEDTGIHEMTIYKYCSDLIKGQARRSTGRPATIKKEVVIEGLKKGLTQQEIADIFGTTRQGVCMFIKRHELAGFKKAK